MFRLVQQLSFLLAVVGWTSSVDVVSGFSIKHTIIQHHQQRHQQGQQQQHKHSYAATKRTKFIQRTNRRREYYAVPPELQHLQDMMIGGDHSTTAHALQDSITQFHDHLVTLADAAAASAAEVTENAPDMGPEWWQAYLRIFKNTLSFVHSTVDQPLRNVGVTQTWGVSIALFTIAMRSLLIPLSIQQNKSSEYMKALKPYIRQIKEKFKDNENARNNAVGKLYEDAQQNPLAGCLVSLAQLPILLGLYRGIRLLAQEGKLNEPFLWIPSLEGPVTAASNYRGFDWLTTGWHIDAITGQLTPQLGWETTLAFLIMPVTLVALQSFTMSTLSPPMDDDMSDEERETFERSQVVLKFLPFLIGFFSLQVPAGLTIYWFTTNLFTLSQSLAVRAYFAANPPEIELPDYWDNINQKDIKDMTPEERRQAVQAGLSIGPTMDDLLDEAKFHCLIERVPIRDSIDSDILAANGSDLKAIPPEFEEWVELAAATVAAEVIELGGGGEGEGGAPAIEKKDEDMLHTTKVVDSSSSSSSSTTSSSESASSPVSA